ncbi:hypothetical protein [Microbacterium sp. SLBN-146]|uniref:hypothetical protein n=1 Tax=Microbacterium sp. SLBN-146 TaxID=2768457 RepID=UPI001152B1D8|nr:hypothetical protein [Microbacterium sp. SLBN-146]TQJ31308.1 hypothetical protein FBY39_1772 [Microbacterium sp. SLBN-146]
MSRISLRRGTAVLATALIAASGVLFVANAAEAKTTSTGGDYAVTVNGTTYNPAAGKDIKLQNLAVSGKITVSGRNNRFTIDAVTLGVYDYTLTGTDDTQRMVTAPTVVFSSKVPTLTDTQRSGVRLSKLEVKDDAIVAIFTTAAGKLKVQAKDGAQGGIFQMEPEFASPVEIVHTLGPGLFYFVNEFTGKINFGDGTDAVASGTNAHQMLIGKDSPQVAVKTFQSGTVTKWVVQPGGRMGGVLGEDAIELSAGATNCTGQCQARNRVNGSLPVPPDPVNPTPIG